MKQKPDSSRHLCKGTEIEINSCISFFPSAAPPAEGRFTQTDLAIAISVSLRLPAVCLNGSFLRPKRLCLHFWRKGGNGEWGRVWKSPACCSCISLPCTRFYIALRPDGIPLSALPFPLPLPFGRKTRKGPPNASCH